MKILLTLIVFFFSYKVISNEIQIDEDISKLEIKDLKKIKTKDIEKIIFGTVSFGFYSNGDTFESIYFSNTKGEKAKFSIIINENEKFNGVYKVTTSKICFLIDNAKDWECSWLYKKNKSDKKYYWAFKGKIYAKTTNFIDIKKYKKIENENNNKKNQSQNSQNNELNNFNIDKLKKINFTTQDFSILTEHPNSHYFYTCGAGGWNGCGSYLGEQYRNLMKSLKKITGLKKINVEIYNNLNSLNRRQLSIINGTNQQYNQSLSNLKTNLYRLEEKCRNYKEFFDTIPKKCFEFDRSIPSKILDIENSLTQYATVFNEFKLNNNYLNNLDTLSQNILNLMNQELINITNLIGDINKPIVEKENEIRIAKENKEKEEERKRQEEERKRKEEERKRQEEERKRIAKEKNDLDNFYLRGHELTEIEQVKRYIYYVEEFIKINPNEFDIIKLTELMILNRNISEENWSEEKKENFMKLEIFTKNSSIFVKFYENNLIIKRNNLLKTIYLQKDQIQELIQKLKNYETKYPNSNLIAPIKERINLANTILDEKNSLRFPSLIIDLDEYTKMLTQLTSEIKTSKKIITYLKEYLTENINSTYAQDVIIKIKELENILNTEKLNALQQKNNEILQFVSLNNLKSTNQLKEEEMIRIKIENEKKHFYVLVVCDVVEDHDLFSEGENIFSSLLGVKKQEVKKTQEEFRQNYCDCVNAKANDHFTPERIKEANKQNKFNEENADGTPKAMTMNEMLFFVGAQTKCMSGITSKYSMWLDAFIN